MSLRLTVPAQGVNLFIPPIEGVDTPDLFICKTLQEADRLVGREGSHTEVIGSGAIGVEAAEALKRIRFEVTVTELLDGRVFAWRGDVLHILTF
ncbi:MAG: FAD-dependent oxidoreductase [Desulfatiglandaceae bacterium]